MLSNPFADSFANSIFHCDQKTQESRLLASSKNKVCQHISETKEPQQALLPAAALVYMDSDLLQTQFQFLVLNPTNAIKKKANDLTKNPFVIYENTTYITFTALNN